MLEIVKNYHSYISNRKLMILSKSNRRSITCAKINYTALAKKKKKRQKLIKEEKLSKNQLLKPFGQYLRIKEYLVKELSVSVIIILLHEHKL